MTLPTDVLLPLQSDLIKAGDPETLELYLRNLIETLTERDRQVVGNVNGTINQFSPVVKGSVTAGTGTYAAGEQVGWYLRQGIIVDVWFDVIWSAHTGAGFIYVELPYQVAASPNSTVMRPFVGQMETSGITYTVGYTSTFGEGEPNTFKYNLVQTGSAQTAALLAIPGSGRLLGHVRYIGKDIEN